MYNPTDTIFAISSPTSSQRVIIRITGVDTLTFCQKIFKFEIPLQNKRVISNNNISIDSELSLDCKIYFFPSPHSYTGDDLAEIHIDTNPSVIEAVLDKLLNLGLRIAEPGEFTARAYLNGQIDLAQAEAVNEIIVCSNEYQLSAAQNLLSGQLSQSTNETCQLIMDCLSKIEAGLDFSSEDIEFITREDAINTLTEIKNKLDRLLIESLRYESVMELPSVGIAGAPNAGKSTLTNALLGTERSIVSNEKKTTRDVLTGLLQLEHCNCVLFDCAGLIIEPENILDELAQQRAIEALHNSSIVIMCIDISIDNFSEDLSIRKLYKPKLIIPIATKCDLIAQNQLNTKLANLNKLFEADFLAVSTKTNSGIKELTDKIDSYLISDTSHSESSLTLTPRHKKSVSDVILNLSEAIEELHSGNEEVCAMILRAAYKSISQIQQDLSSSA